MSNSVFAKILGELEEASGKLFDTYISGDSPREVNILYASKTKMAADMAADVLHPNMYAASFHHIAAMLMQNFLHRFLLASAKEGVTKVSDGISIATSHSSKKITNDGISPTRSFLSGLKLGRGGRVPSGTITSPSRSSLEHSESLPSSVPSSAVRATSCVSGGTLEEANSPNNKLSNKAAAGGKVTKLQLAVDQRDSAITTISLKFSDAPQLKSVALGLAAQKEAETSPTRKAKPELNSNGRGGRGGRG